MGDPLKGRFELESTGEGKIGDRRLRVKNSCSLIDCFLPSGPLPEAMSALVKFPILTAI
jgi:hypothetical protein